MGFEELIEGQLPPDEWYDSGCADSFPFLSPCSGVGRKTLELSMEYGEASLALQQRRQQAIDGLPFSEGEFEELDRAFFLARDRWGVAFGLYYSIRMDLEFGDDDVGEIPYDQAVVNACSEQQKNINENWYLSWRKKENLRELTNQLGMLYRLETDCHFIELVQK